MTYIKQIFGLLFLILGIVGVFIPILPSFPFFLLSLILFASSNEKFYKFLISTDFYDKNVKDLREDGKMSRKNKAKSLIILGIFLSIGFYFMKDTKAKWILPVVFIFHFYLFFFKIKDLD